MADFTTPATLKLVDLRTPRKIVSPFLLADADDIGRMRNDLRFLERLGNELTRPILPQSAAIDYTPSQYLCKFIKKCGYQGVIYRSSVSNGVNLALFDPSLANIRDRYSVPRGLVSQLKSSRDRPYLTRAIMRSAGSLTTFSPRRWTLPENVALERKDFESKLKAQPGILALSPLSSPFGMYKL